MTISGTTAKFLTSVYDANIDINQRLLDLLKNLGSTSQVELMDQMSSFEVERGERFADLIKPTTLALMLLIDREKICQWRY